MLPSALSHALSNRLTPADLATARPLDGGTYNAAWWIDSPTGPVVVKVAPPSDKPCLSYEVDLMTNEIAYYEATAGLGIAQPGLVGHDGASWIAIDGLPGRTLISLASELSEGERVEIDEQVGAALATLHSVRRTSFGYPHRPQTQHATWTEAFTAMVGLLFDDADRYGVTPPLSRDQVMTYVERLAPVLATVTAASLVHFDVWDGNVLVDGSRVALIDGERAFWGDPVAEFASPGVFADVRSRTGLFTGYGSNPLDEPGARARLLLYSCYLYTIMVVEMAPRGNEDEGLLGFLAFRLTSFATELDELLSGSTAPSA